MLPPPKAEKGHGSYSEIPQEPIFLHWSFWAHNARVLTKDLSESGDDKRVIYAMISNFQNRIDVLQTVIERVDAIKQLKQMTL